MTLEQIREILRTVSVQETMMPNTMFVRGLTLPQLREIVLLAQSQLCELECRVPVTEPNNPS
jgi:hypothetical protein